MIRVVGFEGSMENSAHVTWGAAAIEEEGGRIRNAVTGRTAPAEEMFRMVNEGLVTRLDAAVEVPDEWEGAPMVVAAIRTTSPHYELLRVDPGQFGGIKPKRAGPYHAYVCRSSDAFTLLAREMNDQIMMTVLGSSTTNATHLELVRLGLVLDPTHAHLNALRVYLAGDASPELSRLGRANTRGTVGQAQFDLMLQALKNKDKRYELTYEHGLSDGGGFDVDVVSDLFAYFRSVHPKFRAVLIDEYPFLPPPPAPRLFELRATASATLSFGADVNDRTLGERVARYLELRLLERSLGGETPPDLARDPGFGRALEGIARLDERTTVQQKRIEADEMEPVEVEESLAGTIVRHQVRVLGVHTGLYKDGEKAEIRILTGLRGRLLLSLLDNGEGNPPLGADMLSYKQSLFEPLIVRLARYSDQYGREKFALIEAEPLQERTEVSAVPSGVVDGAFALVDELSVRRTELTLEVGERAIRIPKLETIGASLAWLKKYSDVAYLVELQPNRVRAWLPPGRVVRPRSLDRALVSLDALGGEADVSRLVEEISRRFETQVRVNNTRREVLRNPALLEFIGDERKTVKLTELGKRHADIYRAAGGGLGQESSQS